MLSTESVLQVARKQIIRPVDLPNNLGKSNQVVGVDLSGDKVGYALALDRGWNIIFEQLPQRKVQKFVLVHLDSNMDQLVKAFLKALLEDQIEREVTFYIKEVPWQVGLVSGVKLFATRVYQ